MQCASVLDNCNKLFFSFHITLPQVSKLAKLAPVSHCGCHYSANEIRFTNKMVTHMTLNWQLWSVHLDNESVWT